MNQSSEIDPIAPYDAVVDIVVLPTLDRKEAGWELKIPKRLQPEVMDKIKDVKDGAILSLEQTKAISQILFPEELAAVRVSVLGLFDRGKTYLLNKLANSNLPSGRRVRTKGISVKRSNESNHIGRKVLFLDTAGTKEPLLKKRNCRTCCDIERNETL